MVWFCLFFDVMAAPHAQVPRSGSGAQPLSFVFPIPWNYLAEPFGAGIEEQPAWIEEKPARQTPIPVIVPTPPAEPTSPPAVRAPVVALEFSAPKPSSPDSWGMAIPKPVPPAAPPSPAPL